MAYIITLYPIFEIYTLKVWVIPSFTTRIKYKPYDLRGKFILLLPEHAVCFHFLAAVNRQAPSIAAVRQPEIVLSTFPS